MSRTTTMTAKAAKFSPTYIPQYTECFVRKAGTRGAWRRHTTTSAVPTGAGMVRPADAQFFVNGDTEYYQFTAMGFDIVVKESAITYDVIEAAVSGGGCAKCDGRGFIDAFRHVANGECFWCKGKGK